MGLRFDWVGVGLGLRLDWDEVEVGLGWGGHGLGLGRGWVGSGWGWVGARLLGWGSVKPNVKFESQHSDGQHAII